MIIIRKHIVALNNNNNNHRNHIITIKKDQIIAYNINIIIIIIKSNIYLTCAAGNLLVPPNLSNFPSPLKRDKGPLSSSLILFLSSNLFPFSSRTKLIFLPLIFSLVDDMRSSALFQTLLTRAIQLSPTLLSVY